MNKSLRNLVALVLSLTAATTFAAESTSVKARAALRSCGYYSVKEVEVTLSYYNNNSAEVPWGTNVNLLYGWGGYSSTPSNTFTWNSNTSVAAPATAGWTWGVTVTKQIAARSSPVFIESIDFVWQIVRPDGSVIYKKGNSSPMGYYVANFKAVSDSAPCTSTADFIGTPVSLAVTSVEQW